MADQTTTVLTIDLPGDLGDRLRGVLYQRPDRSIRDITIEALAEWLDRQEAADPPGSATGDSDS
jgi:predicted transcriptional regulator